MSRVQIIISRWLIGLLSIDGPGLGPICYHIWGIQIENLTHDLSSVVEVEDAEATSRTADGAQSTNSKDTTNSDGEGDNMRSKGLRTKAFHNNEEER